MRFDSTLYYHFGEEYEWEPLIDEFREWIGMLDQGALLPPGWPSTTSTGMAGHGPPPTPYSSAPA